ncbi:sorbitol/mannitol transport system substrate-binding protein [Janthinobacterium sp. CG_23.3]|uniref:extracellular solute-binding protein n=1 Tax=Janthinobacterium sp. CG_23.3 TaxID=3349634 RepID=UPI0038D4B540
MLSNKLRTFTLPALLALLLAAAPRAEPLVTLAASERTPYIGTTLPENGYVSEVATEAFKRRGYRVKIAFYPLARALQLAQTGEVDAVLPLAREAGEGGTAGLAYSLPFPGDSIGLLRKRTLAPHPAPGAADKGEGLLASLNAHRVGVVRGAAAPAAFDNAKIAHREAAANDLQNLDKLERDRIDFALIDKYTAADLMVGRRPHLIGDYEFIMPPLAQRAFHVAFATATERQRQLLVAFNEGLADMTRDGTLTGILKKHGLYSPAKAAKNKTRLVIATVNNSDMLVMRALSVEYQKQHPGIELEWRVLDEEVLRLRLLSDLAISDGQFDILTIGTYETPIWAKRGWLTPLQPPDNYDVDDLLPAVRSGLSYQKQLYALPFYAESVMTYYRKDLFAKAGLAMPVAPSYDDIKALAAKLHKPAAGIYGVCLRGKPGWGDNMALLTSMASAYGGRWFDEQGQPDLDSAAWEKTVEMYRDLLTRYGPPNPERNSFKENLRLFSDGHCGIWIDATVAASVLSNPLRSNVASQLGYVAAPGAPGRKGGAWLWSWALAVPNSSLHKAEAAQFIAWATSKNYIGMVAKYHGWAAIPPGTRKSTYQNENYLKAAPFAQFVLGAIESADQRDAGLKPGLYREMQYVSIPEFPAIGDQVGQEMAATLSGRQSVRQALAAAQALVLRQMKDSGYLK